MTFLGVLVSAPLAPVPRGGFGPYMNEWLDGLPRHTKHCQLISAHKRPWHTSLSSSTFSDFTVVACSPVLVFTPEQWAVGSYEDLVSLETSLLSIYQLPTG